MIFRAVMSNICRLVSICWSSRITNKLPHPAISFTSGLSTVWPPPPPSADCSSSFCPVGGVRGLTVVAALHPLLHLLLLAAHINLRWQGFISHCHAPVPGPQSHVFGLHPSNCVMRGKRAKSDGGRASVSPQGVWRSWKYQHWKVNVALQSLRLVGSMIASPSLSAPIISCTDFQSDCITAALQTSRRTSVASACSCCCHSAGREAPRWECVCSWPGRTRWGCGVGVGGINDVMSGGWRERLILLVRWPVWTPQVVLTWKFWYFRNYYMPFK